MESHASMVPSMLFLPLDMVFVHVEDAFPDRSLSLESIRSACRFQRSLALFDVPCLLACCTYHVPNAHAVPATASALHHHAFEDVDVLLSAIVAAQRVVLWLATTSRALSSWSCRLTEPRPDRDFQKPPLHRVQSEKRIRDDRASRPHMARDERKV